MISKVVTLLILLCIPSRNNGVVAGPLKEEDLSVEEELETLTKPPVQTIQLEGGDVVDCIDFYKQPAFDHPLLKDHKVQMLPQSYLARREKQLQASRSTGKACPSGTVPIRRTTKEGLMTTRTDNPRSIFAANTGNSHMVYVNMRKLQSRRYRGASGFASVHNFIINPNQFSTAMVWAANGLNYITVGWMVTLHWGKSPRLFIYWSADGGHKTGCYNLECKGFVQVDSKIAPGHLLEQVSTYGGPTYDIKIKLHQDKQTGNWIFSAFKEDIIIGYMPKEVLTILKYGAEHIAWGGEAYAGTDGISPPMGDGHTPDGQYNHSAYFKNLLYYGKNYIPRCPTDYNTDYHVDKSGCYGLHNGSDHRAPWWSSFLYGGPGGRCPN